MPHPSWQAPHKKSRAVDKKGLAVALAFLVGMTLVAGGRGGNTADLLDRSQPRPVLSAQVDIRQTAKAASQRPTTAQGESLSALGHNLKNPRQGSSAP
jgi:hypothetical protein